MMDVAALGFSVDSSQVRTATADLDKLTNAAARAEAAASSFGGGAGNAAAAAARVAPAAANAAQALERQASSASNAKRALSEASDAAEKLAAKESALRAQSANIAAQFQDIGVQLAGGQSPFLIAMQQGSQLSAALGAGGGGVRGALSALATGFAELFSPLNLVTTAAIAAGGMLVQYLMKAYQNAGDSNAEIKEQVDLIRSVAQQWGDALPALKAYNDERQRGEDIEKRRQGVNAAVNLSWTGVHDIAKDFNVDIADEVLRLQDAGVDPRYIKAFQDTWAKLTNEIQNNTATTEDVRNAQTTLSLALHSKMMPAVDGMAARWSILSNAIDAASQSSRKLMRDLSTPLNKFPEEVEKTKAYADAMRSLVEISPHLSDLEIAQKSLQTGLASAEGLEERQAVIRQYDSALKQIKGKDSIANGNVAAEVDKQAEAYRKLIGTQQEQAQNLQLEANLIGASVLERARQAAALQAEQQLRQNGIDLLAKEGQAYEANAVKLAELKTQIERQKAAYDSLQQAEGSIIDTLVNGLSTMGTNWKDTFKNMAQQALQWLNQLAIANPLKNWITGSNLPTLQDLFSGKPTVPGATTTGTMTVTAATVMVNGAPVGLPGTGGLAGLIGYNPANNNVPPIGAAPVIPVERLPLPSIAERQASLAAQPDLIAGVLAAKQANAGFTKSGIPLANISSASGRTTQVNSQYAGNFQGFVNDLQAQGYQINRLEGYNYRNIDGTNRLSNHAYGNAIDINPDQNPVTYPGKGQGIITDLPPNVQETAAKYGLEQGIWKSKYDPMHFEVAKNATPLSNPQVQQVNQNLTKMSSNLTSTSKDVANLGDTSFDAGKSLADAFKSPAQPSALPSAAPQQSLPANYFPPAPSGGFNLFGLFGSLFKGIFSLFGFAEGGYTGHGGKYQPAGIVHRGEYVVNANATSRFRPMLEAMNGNRMPGYAGGGLVGHRAPNIPSAPEPRPAGSQRVKVEVVSTVDRNGNFKSYVKSVSQDTVDARVPGHLKAYDEEHLPRRVAQISGDRYARG